MTHDLILKSFQATGIWPMDASRAKFEAKRLSQGLHSLQVNNELLRLQNAELRAELNLIRKRPIKSTTLTTREGDEWHGGAVFYSPRKLASERARKAAELDEAAELQLQKARDREIKAAEAAEKKCSQEAAKVARQQAKIAKDAEQLRQREEKAAKRALKKQQQQAATAQKSRDTANKRKREASHKPAKKSTKRRRVVAPSSGVVAGPPEASPPPKFSLRNRQIKMPARYK
ncbi:hypothetical protein L13192_10713 [Pyrenophora tritici-repentis]|nr:hypothetical protein L13192_10713 [Pyrenophora tritici-repentis]